MAKGQPALETKPVANGTTSCAVLSPGQTAQLNTKHRARMAQQLYSPLVG
jgi:hypothetical protein